MKKIAVVTDSNSGITQKEGEALGIYVVPMPFYIDGQVYYEGINLDRETFFEKQDQGAEITTSQPSPGDVMDLWDRLLEKEGYEEIVYIPMSSGLSGSCHTALTLAEDYDGRVYVVDNQRISVTQKQSVMDALQMVEDGKSGAQIKKILEIEKLEASIYITLDTLKYLKKGGRITPAAAAIGTVLNLKPVLQIQGEKLDAYAKVRGEKKARKIMKDAVHKDLSQRFKEAMAGDGIKLHAAHTTTDEEAVKWAKDLMEEFPSYEIVSDPLSLSVSCHIGRGAVAVAVTKVPGNYEE
ncbi:MAG: DegV family protein [Lachnospiraceae bacterium]|nr:DegV family protein [Lachnospiraceae bacterium]